MVGEPFVDVTLPKTFPSHDVADCEVFMSFGNDEDALLFRDWWNEKGAVLFNQYARRARQRRDRGE